MKILILCLAVISMILIVGVIVSYNTESSKIHLDAKDGIEVKSKVWDMIANDGTKNRLDIVNESVAEVKALEDGLYMKAEGNMQGVSQSSKSQSITASIGTLGIPKLSHRYDHALRPTSLVKFLDTSAPKYKEFEKRTAALQIKYDGLRESFHQYEKQVRSSIKDATPLKDEHIRLNKILENKASYKQNKKLWDEYIVILNKLIPYMKTMNIAQKKLVLLKMDALSMRTELHLFQAEMGDLRYIDPCNIDDKDIPIILKECDTTVDGYKVKLNNYIDGLKNIPENDGSLESHYDSAKQSIEYIKNTGNAAVVMSDYIDFIEEAKYRIKSNLFLKSTRRD